MRLPLSSHSQQRRLWDCQPTTACSSSTTTTALATLTHVTRVLEGHTASAQLTRFTEVGQQLRTLASTAQPDGGRLRASEDIAYVNDVDRPPQDPSDDDRHPLVVDVHTKPSSQRVLEASLGTPLVVAIGPESALRGTRFNCYEFTHPLAQRLTVTSCRPCSKPGRSRGRYQQRCFLQHVSEPGTGLRSNSLEVNKDALLPLHPA
jgi:hypothetical protein